MYENQIELQVTPDVLHVINAALKLNLDQVLRYIRQRFMRLVCPQTKSIVTFVALVQKVRKT